MLIERSVEVWIWVIHVSESGGLLVVVVIGF